MALELVYMVWEYYDRVRSGIASYAGAQLGVTRKFVRPEASFVDDLGAD